MADQVRHVYDVPDGVDDTVTFVLAPDGRLWITIDSPWQGDTESGFGAKLTQDIDPEETKALIEKLYAAIRKDK